MHWVVALVLVAMVGAQRVNPTEIGQREHSPDMKFSSRTPYTLPQEMFEFLEKYNWGDFHMVFHMSRKYYVMGEQGRRWLDEHAEKPAPYQEGDPNNGLEFLAMHRAMLEYLRERFGKLAVSGDPEGRKTVSEVLDGWVTDDDCARGLQRFGGDVETFRRGLSNVNNFAGFRTEDEFGNFIQTSMRLVGQVDPANPAKRQYTYDRRPGSGVHNWLHGQLMDDNSPITVGDPRTNLPNILFWRIHGWIENKWKAFERAHRRSDVEKALYDGFMTQFRAHMVRMSEKGSSTDPQNPLPPAPPAPRPTTRTSRRTTRRPRSGRSLFGDSERQARVEAYAAHVMGREARNIHRSHHAARRRVPWALVYHLRNRMFRNHVPECRTLTRGTITDNCPYGPDEPNAARGDAQFPGFGAPRDAPNPEFSQPRRQPPSRKWWRS